MLGDETPRIVISETGLSAPDYWASSNLAALEGSVDVLRTDDDELMASLRGKVFRVMDDQLFIVEPGSPPPQFP